MSHEPDRKYLHCVLCGVQSSAQNRLTREHIFGAAIAEAFPSDQNWRTEDGIKGNSPLLRQTSRCLCKGCNEGCSSVAIERALPVLVPLARGDIALLNADESSRFHRYWERVALLMDVLRSNFDLTEAQAQSKWQRHNKPHRVDPPLISHQHRNDWRDGGSIPFFRVSVGRHTGILGLAEAVDQTSIRIDLSHETSRRPLAGKVVAVALCKIVVIAELGVNPWPLPLSFSQVKSGAPFDINQAKREVSYDDYYSVLSQDDRVVRLRNLFADQDRTRRIEDASRRAGRPVLPPEYKRLLYPGK
jgi:hypothetical protein